MSDQEIRELEVELRLHPHDQALRLLLLRKYLQSQKINQRTLEDLALAQDPAAKFLIGRELVPDRTFSAVEYLMVMKASEPKISREDYLHDAAALVATYGQLHTENCDQSLGWLYREVVSSLDSFENYLLLVFGSNDLRERLNRKFTDERLRGDPELIHRLRLAGENLGVPQPWFEERTHEFFLANQNLIDHEPTMHHRIFLMNAGLKNLRIIRYLNSKLRAYIRLYWELQTDNGLGFHRKEGLDDFIRGLNHYWASESRSINLLSRYASDVASVNQLMNLGRQELIRLLLPSYTPE